MCYTDRKFDIDQWEAEYEYLAVPLQITGTRPAVMPEQTGLAVAAQFSITINNQLQIHVAPPPHDFLLILLDQGAYLTMLGGDRTVHTPGFSLAVRPWSRLMYAKHGEPYHKVLIEMEGIPVHVWTPSTATDLLREYFSIVRMESETANRSDLSVFRLTAWTTRPEFIPE